MKHTGNLKPEGRISKHTCTLCVCGTLSVHYVYQYMKVEGSAEHSWC